MSRPAGATVRQRIRSLDPRVMILALLIVSICALFWSGSRYPSLQGKASAEPSQALATPLGFEQHIAAPAPDQTGMRILWTALEWGVTNRQGMGFGLLLAAGMLSLMPLLRRPGRGRFSGALEGGLIGAPLGVCVNCAAPIGQAMIHAGGRVEVALATMFASPSFNVIVIGMLVSMFPAYLVGIKLLASATMVLLVVPWLARLAERPGWRRPLRAPAALPGLRAFQWLDQRLGVVTDADVGNAQALGWWAALNWTARTYLQNLWRVIRVALPLMVLAGLLGAVMVELLPWTQLAQWARTGNSSLLLLLLAVFGMLLPVPIAFDVIICAVLYEAGVPVGLVAALLVTLGLYSVYPMSLLGTTLSWRIAGLAGVAVALLGVLAGLAGNALEHRHALQQAQLAASLIGAGERSPVAQPVLPVGEPAGRLRAAALPVQAYAAYRADDGWSLAQAGFETPLAARTDTPFKRLDGAATGFKRLPLPRPYQTMVPGVMHLSALAAGDINDDGWPDVAMGSHFGVYLYANLGGQFEQQSIDFPAMRDWIIGDVALVDLDADGALDLFFSTWEHGSHILYNRDGSYSAAAHRLLPRGQESGVHVAAFADVDRDGDLDIVTGGVTLQSWFFYPDTAVNTLWRNVGGEFEPEILPGPQGETLTLLFFDANADGWPDLFVGNDFDEPDQLLLNHDGELQAVVAATSPIPYSTTTTMSSDHGDLDNDGRDELYIGEIALGAMADLARQQSAAALACEHYATEADQSRCQRLAAFQTAVTAARDRQTVDYCGQLHDPAAQRECAVTAYHWDRIQVRLPSAGASRETVMAECAQLPEDFTVLVQTCQTMAGSRIDHNRAWELFPDSIASVSGTNLLFAPTADGYVDVTRRWHAAVGGWSWNARFADLDNDGWQDLYVAQGSRLRRRNRSALYYHNLQGQRFEEATQAAGLSDHRPTGATLFLDYDLDGDLDLISYPFQLSPVVWRNDAPVAAGLELELRDQRSANRHGLGARAEIRHRDGRMKVRSVKASGGYQSHDAPRLHFGLGDWDQVHSLRILWPDGSSQYAENLDLAPGRYRWTRESSLGSTAPAVHGPVAAR